MIQTARVGGVLAREKQARPRGSNGPIPEWNSAGELKGVELDAEVGEIDERREWEDASELLQPDGEARRDDCCGCHVCEGANGTVALFQLLCWAES